MKKILLVCLALFCASCYSYVRTKTVNYNDDNLSVDVQRYKTGEFYQFDLSFKNKSNYLMRVHVACRWYSSGNDKPASELENTVFNIEPKSVKRYTRKTLVTTYGYYWDCPFGYKLCR